MGILKNYFQNSSLHGLFFIANDKLHWSERLFWLICVAGSWTGSILFVISALDSYNSQKITVSIDTAYLHWITQFPAVVFCEIDNDLSALNEKLFGSSYGNLPTINSLVYFDGTLNQHHGCDKDSPLRDKCILGNYSAYMQYRSKCHEIIGTCYYNGEQFPCCDEFLPIDSNQGTCFAFNSIASGKYKTTEELPFTITRSINYNYGNLSVQLLKLNVSAYSLSQDAIPTIDNPPILYGKPLPTYSLYKVFLAVQQICTHESSRIITIKNRGCRFYDENNLQITKVYSKSACEIECLIEAQLEFCNCSVHTLPHNNSIDCDFDGLLCNIHNYNEIRQKGKSCYCIESCFNMEVNFVGQTRSVLGKDILEENSLARIDFLVPPPTLRYTRNAVKTPLQMLVSLGGTTGVFIGASFLTIVEIFYYFFMRPLDDKILQKNKKNNLIKIKQKRRNPAKLLKQQFIN